MTEFTQLALLCKLSRDGVSRNGHCYANRTDINGIPSTSLYGIAVERKEKGNCNQTDKRKKENGFLESLGKAHHLLEGGRHFLGLDMGNAERLGSL